MTHDDPCMKSAQPPRPMHRIFPVFRGLRPIDQFLYGVRGGAAGSSRTEARKRATPMAAAGMIALALSGLGISAQAQQADSLQQKWLLPYPEDAQAPPVEIAAEKARSAPGTSTGSQIAFGASWGTAYAGIGYQHRTRYLSRMDGAASVGFGLGNAQKLVGLDLSVASLGSFRSFGRYSLGVKAHRILPGNAAIAVGMENAAVIGFTDSRRSLYAVGSKQFTLRETPNEFFSSLMVSAGAGNGRYLSESDFSTGKNGMNLFGSVGLRVAEPVGLIADWTGQDLALAVSLVPFKSIPLVITPGLADVTGTAGDGARFTVGAGVGVHFLTFPSTRRR